MRLSRLPAGSPPRPARDVERCDHAGSGSSMGGGGGRSFARNDVAGAADVLGDGVDEGGGGVEALFVAQALDELDRDGMTDQVALEVEEEGLDVERFDAERGVGANADGRDVRA